MKLAANDADGVPFTIPSTKYSFVNDWVIVAELADVLDTQRARDLRTKRRYIESVEVYDIRYYDIDGRMQSLPGTFYSIYDTLTQAEDIVYQIEPLVQKFDDDPSLEPTQQEYNAIVAYINAMNLIDGITQNEKFASDYDTMLSYWDLNGELRGKLNLKDVIRLFNSDEAMYLATDGANPRILATGESLPEGYHWVGKLNPTVNSHIDGTRSDYILAADGYYIDVDKDAAIAAKIVDESERDMIVDRVDIILDKSVITRDHLMMLDLFANFDWKRALAFTQTSMINDYGIIDYARFNGYSYLFVPIKTSYTRGSDVGSMDIDAITPQYLGEECSELHQPLRFGGLNSEDVYADYFVRYNLSASRLRENFARIASAHIRRGTDESVATAERLLDRGLEVLPPQRVGYTHNAILPYVRGYYYSGLYYLGNAIEYLEEAVNMMSEMLDMTPNIIDEGDDFAYYNSLSDNAAAMQSTARSRGLSTAAVDELLAKSDEESEKSDRLFEKGDLLAVEYIAERGEWVDYYLQYNTRESISPTVSSELYNAMLDIIEVINHSHLYAGSFEWVANPDPGRALMDNQLSFDRLAKEYISYVNRLTPGDERDPYMQLMQYHVSNVVEIYRSLPASRLTELGIVDAEYVEEMETLLSRRELQELINQMINE